MSITKTTMWLSLGWFSIEKQSHNDNAGFLALREGACLIIRNDFDGGVMACALGEKAREAGSGLCCKYMKKERAGAAPGEVVMLGDGTKQLKLLTNRQLEDLVFTE